MMHRKRLVERRDQLSTVYRRWAILALAGAGICMLAAEVRRAIAQRAVVEDICDRGGTVVYDWEQSATNRETPTRSWFRVLAGDDFLAHVVIVYLYGATPGHIDDLRLLQRLSGLRSLYLNDTTLTDDALTHVGSLVSLRELYLRDTKIANKHLRFLKDLTHLEKLDLAWCNVDDSSLEFLGRLRSLNLLDVTGTRITKDGLTRLSGAIPKCKVIHASIGK